MLQSRPDARNDSADVPPSLDSGSAAASASWFLQHGLDIFLVTDINSVVMEVNPAWTRVLGWAPHEVIGFTLYDFIHPDDVGLTQANGLTLRQSGSVRQRLRLAVKGGGWRLFDGQSQEIVGGRLMSVLHDVTDISEMATARRAADKRTARLKLALKSVEAAVFEIDHIKKTFWCAREFHQMMGRSLTYEEAIGVWPMVHPDDHEMAARSFESIAAEEIRRFVLRVILPNGRALWTQVQFKEHHDRRGRPTKVVGLVMDVDAAHRQALALEEAERRATVAAAAKSNFLANISHEIRTPMNGVLGVLQLIKREHLDAEELGLLDEAQVSGRMLVEMLDDLLDFSKIETGAFELHAEPLDPSAILVGVASLLQPAASAKGLTMRAVAEPGLGMISADPLRLRQALYNLMGNAVKFTPTGSIEARLTRHGDRLRFEVQDTGVGVPLAAQATLFERFEQADSSLTRVYGGSGLGLAITRRLAEMMGGSVGFSSEPGQGSTFWIEIDGKAVEPAANDPVIPDIGAFRVLLVEDNATNRLVISKLLEALGVVVDTACDGSEGVAAAAKGGYDLVLMDIQMPGMDGIEATRRIRAMDGAPGATPILAVTANVLAEQRTSYTQAGMNGVVSKPISAAALFAEIARVTDCAA